MRRNEDLYMLYLGAYGTVMSGAVTNLAAGCDADAALANTIGATSARSAIEAMRSNVPGAARPLSMERFMVEYAMLSVPVRIEGDGAPFTSTAPEAPESSDLLKEVVADMRRCASDPGFGGIGNAKDAMEGWADQLDGGGAEEESDRQGPDPK